MTIRTPPANKNYLDNFDKIFNKPAEGVSPSHYTNRECGEWQKWDGKPIPSDILDSVIGNRNFEYDGHSIHSIQIYEPIKGVFKRWDCINGWN